MSFKKHLRMVASYFFVIDTLINVAIYIMGEVFRPEERFGYDAFLSPLIYAAIAVIPMLCMYSKKELTRKQYLIREVLMFFAIEFLLIFFGIGTDCLEPDNIAPTASFALSVFIIYVCVYLISWALDWKTSKTLNSELKIFQIRVLERDGINEALGGK